MENNNKFYVDEITMDVVDGISLPGERVDEHPCASCHSRLGDLGEGQGEQGFHHCVIVKLTRSN